MSESGSLEYKGWTYCKGLSSLLNSSKFIMRECMVGLGQKQQWLLEDVAVHSFKKEGLAKSLWFVSGIGKHLPHHHEVCSLVQKMHSECGERFCTEESESLWIIPPECFLSES